MTDRAGPIPPQGPVSKPQRRRWWIVPLALAGLALLAFYLKALNESFGGLDVTLVNVTGGPLTDVVFGEMPHLTPVPRVETGATVHVRIPLTKSPRIAFRSPDGASRSNLFEFYNTSGMTHRLKVILGNHNIKYLSWSSSTWLIGAESFVHRPYDFGDPEPAPAPPSEAP